MLSHPFRPARLAAAALLLAVALAACSSPGGATPPPSGACVVADARNTVALTAKDLKFSSPCIQAAAGKPIVIDFTNDDAMPHDVAVYTALDKSVQLAKSDIVNGPNARTTLTVPAQQPGQLYFECNVHPSMNGALLVSPTLAPSASGG